MVTKPELYLVGLEYKKCHLTFWSMSAVLSSYVCIALQLHLCTLM